MARRRVRALRWRSTRQRFQAWLAALPLWRMSRDDLSGYGYALLGVAGASLAIALVGKIGHVSNISLLYLLVVLWLAAWVGRGPAILASVLAFLAYDLFFIQPLWRFTVDDPTEWLSLIALLVTSLVTGQLASAVRDRAREALLSQQRTATLYGVAQLIASATDQGSLFHDLTQRLLKVFTPSGVTGVAILLPDQGIYPTVRALAVGSGANAEQQALRLNSQSYAAEAAWALEHGETVGDTLTDTLRRSSTRPPEAPPGESLVYYIPLISGQRIVGLLAITGKLAIRGLVSPPSSPVAGGSGTSALFAACCDQVALAIDRARLQQQAIHAEALDESNQLKDVFLGSVTHDLRTPLASIKAAVTSLLGADVHWSASERREFLESIDESADRLNRLVGNLLDISRQEAGVATPEKDWYLIGDVIATVLDRLELAGQLQGREVQVDVADDIPLAPMDHTQIEQVLTNLLENALKYSPADRPVRVTAALTDGPERELEVRVSDEGIGVPASELHAIFDKFYRVHDVHLPWASDRPPTGTGLGLAISDNIIRAHDGRIWAESTPGKGSTFIFRLPIPT
ncbi:MAG TPA: ATP-binding protein, partial [Ktedonobacterales bacterium]|nr:ATP-binding protein [Ktedonobacterales bacterium]